MLEPAVATALAHSDRHIAVTGASGWIGRATLDLLAQALGGSFERRVSCYGSTRRTLDLIDGRQIVQHPLSTLATLKARPVWVLHFAFLTKDRAQTMSDDAYRAANRAIGDTVIDALDRIDAEAVFVASSGAASTADDPKAAPAMRLYGAMKRDDEVRFAAWAQARGRRAVIARIFNITGPHINKPDAYAIASFIADTLARRPIAVHAPREVIRGYVAIRELMSLVFALLGEAQAGIVRFDTGGTPLELGVVAERVAEALDGGAVARAAVNDPVADRYVGDGAGYAALLERHRILPVSFEQQVRETAAWVEPLKIRRRA